MREYFECDNCHEPVAEDPGSTCESCEREKYNPTIKPVVDVIGPDGTAYHIKHASGPDSPIMGKSIVESVCQRSGPFLAPRFARGRITASSNVMFEGGEMPKWEKTEVTEYKVSPEDYKEPLSVQLKKLLDGHMFPVKEYQKKILEGITASDAKEIKLFPRGQGKTWSRNKTLNMEIASFIEDEVTFFKEEMIFGESSRDKAIREEVEARIKEEVTRIEESITAILVARFDDAMYDHCKFVAKEITTEITKPRGVLIPDGSVT